MKLTTDIVLVGTTGRTQPYVVQLFPGNFAVSDFTFRRNVDVATSDKSCYLLPKSQHNHLFKNENDWYNIVVNGTDYANLTQATVRLYFPQYSVDTFSHKAKYILTLCTYIHGIEVQLGNYIFERKDALACSPIRFGGMDEYYEYMDFNIIDPHTLLFSDSTADIRTALGVMDNSVEACSLLHACLFIVEEGENSWIKREDWTGGQNSVLISDPEDLTLHTKYNPLTKNIDMTLTFNVDYDDLASYFASVYNCSNVACIVQYVIADSNDIYYEQSKLYDPITSNLFTFSTEKDEGSVLDYRAHLPSFNVDFSLSFDAQVSPYFSGECFFDESGNFKDGLNIQASIIFYDRAGGYDINNPFITIMSNKLSLTPEVFACMSNANRGDDEDNLIPSFINLNTLDMNNINLTATNKIIQNVHMVTPSDSTKKHLLQPVFYQTRNIEGVYVHPLVTENIAINLDSYKSLVDRFKLQIEGVIFNEVGRTNKGIVFKVVGNMLPKEANEGTMYILNQDNDLVTTGKYIYLF